MFYMASFEGLREKAFASSTLTVPTALERQGDFSQTFAANGQLVRIFNPFTPARTRPAASSAIHSWTTASRANMMDPVALNILKYYPPPNQPGDAVTGRNNYYKTGTSNLDTNNTDIRVDRNFGAAGRGFMRYSHRYVASAPLQAFPDAWRSPKDA